MQRRAVLTLIALGSIVPSFALAQRPAPQDQKFGQEAEKYFQNTLETGSLSLETSRIAEEKAQNPWVKRFANYETAEQEGVASLFKTLGGQAPSPEAIDRMPQVRELRELSGQRFEEKYLDVQHEGHEKLLRIQDAFIATGQDPLIADMAKLIKGRVEEHLNLIEAVRGQLRYARR